MATKKLYTVVVERRVAMVVFALDRDEAETIALGEVDEEIDNGGGADWEVIDSKPMEKIPYGWHESIPYGEGVGDRSVAEIVRDLAPVSK